MPAVALIDGLIHRNPSDTQLPRLPQAGPTTDSFRSLLERTSQYNASERPEENASLGQEDSHRVKASDQSDETNRSARERVSSERDRENLRRAEEHSSGRAESDRRASGLDEEAESGRAPSASAQADATRQSDSDEEAALEASIAFNLLSPRERSTAAQGEAQSREGGELSREESEKNGKLRLSSRLEAQAKGSEAKAPDLKDGRKATTGSGEKPPTELADLLKQLETVDSEAGGQEKLVAAAAQKQDSEATLRVSGTASDEGQGKLSQKAQAANLQFVGDHLQKGVASELQGEGREPRGRTGQPAEGEEQADRKVRVVDLRAPKAGERNGGSQERHENGGNQAGLKENADGSTQAEGRTAANRLDGGESAFARQFGVAADSGREVGGQRTVQQQQLHRFLRESGYGEIVRNARIMLREGGNGEIRLNLSPKELGSVRVQLQLQDSHIAGRIIVENSTVREVFEQNLDQLQKAFQSQGLETGRLEVAVQERGEGQQRQDRGRPGRGGGARVFEEHTALVTENFYEDSQVNLMA